MSHVVKRSARLRFAAGAAVLLTVPFVAACGSDSSSSAGATATGATQSSTQSAAGKKVSFLALTSTCQFCSDVIDGVKQTATKAGVKLDVKQNAFDAAQQTQQVNQAIAQKPDSVIVFPADTAAILPALAKLKAAGIPTVVVDSMPDQKQSQLWDAFRGANDVAYGTSAAKALVAGLKAKQEAPSGNVLVVTGTPGSPATVLRLDAFKSTLAQIAPNLKIAATEPGNFDQTTAQTAAAGLFTRFAGQKIVGIYAQADNMLSGVIAAAKRAGRTPNSMVLVGSNCSIEGYNNIKAGDQYATFLDDPKAEGKLAAEAAITLATGGSVPKEVFTPGPTITKANVAECASTVGK